MARRLHTRIGVLVLLGLMVCVVGGLAFYWPVDSSLMHFGFGDDPDAADAPGRVANGAAPDVNVDPARAGVQLTAKPDREATVAQQPVAAGHAEPTRKLKRPELSAGTDGERMADKAAELEVAGKLLEARQFYVLASRAGLPRPRHEEVQRQLLALAEDTLFGPNIVAGDPLSEIYKVQPGDRLSKIARKYRVTPELLAHINNLASPDKIRVDQPLKVLKGPFRAEIVKHLHLIDVYLQDTLVKRFPVGLGEAGGTPTGGWKIKNKLVNPTYYPPDGSGQVIQPGDPENPLGERWLGFEGIDGEALGQEAYGIHGTIEPESIGKDSSKGCVRMHNEDVEVLYDMLIEGHSQVEIFD